MKSLLPTQEDTEFEKHFLLLFFQDFSYLLLRFHLLRRRLFSQSQPEQNLLRKERQMQRSKVRGDENSTRDKNKQRILQKKIFGSATA